MKKLARENKYVLYYHMETHKRRNNDQTKEDFDIRLTVSGKQPYFMLWSVKALEEFKNLMPNKIDRWDYAKKNFGRMCYDSLDQRPSDNEWKRRRDAIMKTIGLNFASKYIPLMLKKMSKYSGIWKEGEWIDFGKEIKCVTFEIITEILFGQEVKDKIGKIRYKDFNGKVTEKDLQDFFMTLSIDTFKAASSIKSVMFPFLIHNNWLAPNNIVHENWQILWTKLRSFLSTPSQDGHKSVYAQVLEMDKSIDKELLMKDMILFYFAGHDTSSHALSSLLYFSRKSQQVYDKLIQEIKNTLQFEDRSKVANFINISTLDSLDYLSYTIKETLRFDNPAAISLGYKALEDINIWGVPLPKDSKIFISIHGNHYSPTQWRQPEKFIPERFDPESDFYLPPVESNEKSRSPYAYIPFSFGLRNWAGKSLATLEVKVLATYLLSKFDFEVDPELIENEYVRFGSNSQFKMKIKIVKKY
jgi:cytochrome P450